MLELDRGHAELTLNIVRSARCASGSGKRQPAAFPCQSGGCDCPPIGQLQLSSYSRQMYRPHDLLKSSLYPTARPPARPSLLGPSKADAVRSDPFHILGINPIDEVLNDELVRRYISQMGKIKTRAETALTWKSQRRVGKMVRRARAMGLISRWTNAPPGARPRA